MSFSVASTGFNSVSKPTQVEANSWSSWVGKKVEWIKNNHTTMTIGYNTFVATAVLGSYLMSKNASPQEYLFDVFVHGSQASLSYMAQQYPEQAQKIHSVLLGLNVLQLYSIYNHMGHSTIPAELNKIDVINHGVNIAEILANLTSKTVPAKTSKTS